MKREQFLPPLAGRPAGPLCPNCGAPTRAGANFCPRCEAPISSYAFTGPGERLRSGWWIYRRLRDGPVSKGTYYVIVTSTILSMAFVLVMAVDTRAPVLALYAVIPVLFLRRIRRQYLETTMRNRKHNEEESEK